MPKNKKQSKTNFKKFVERSRRQKEHQMSKEHDSSNIFGTDSTLLTNEQNLIIDLYNEFSKYSIASLVELSKTQYNEQYGLNIVEEINKNKSWRTWIQGYFDSLWKCLRIFNLKYFFTDYMKTEISDLSYSVDEKDSDKPTLTLNAVFTHINEIMPKYDIINMNSLIYNCIELYFKNKPCKVHNGGNKIQSGGALMEGIMFILIILAIMFAPISEPTQKKTEIKSREKPQESVPEESEPSFLQVASDAYISYKIAQGLFKARAVMRGDDD